MKFNGLIPELSVSDITKSKNFYINVLGFHLDYERFADRFAFLSYGEAQIMIEHFIENQISYQNPISSLSFFACTSMKIASFTSSAV